MTASRLTRAFRAAMHIAPSAYLKGAQIARTRDLLRDTALPLEAVARCCGFGTRVSFFRSFRRTTGVTPTEFRTDAQNCK
jgi:transcriptional regulator GlxA family with amidase domain